MPAACSAAAGSPKWPATSATGRDGLDPELRYSEPGELAPGQAVRGLSHVDTDAARYLKFEKWWGDFIPLNGDELQFLVDNLFIGDKLTRNQIK